MAILTSSALTDALFVVAALTAVVYLYFASVFMYWRRRGVPYPKPLPLFGNLLLSLLQMRSPGGLVKDVYNSAPDAPYVGFYLFNKPALVIKDPNIIKLVMVKDFNFFSDRYFSTSKEDTLGLQNLFTLDGAPWKYLRAKLSPTFTSGRMKKMYPLVVNCARQLSDYLLERSAEKKPIEVKETTAKYSTDVISSSAFGIDSNSLKDPNAEFREFGRNIFNYTRYRTFETTSMFFFPWLTDLMKGSLFTKKTTEFFRRVFWDTINLRESNNITRDDFLNLLIQLKNKGSIDPEDGEKTIDVSGEKDTQVFEFVGDNLMAQAVLFFVAGFETNATTMSFTLYELSLQPEVQRKLRAEIAGVMKTSNGMPTYEDILGMKYLHMVVSETLRKYPPLPLLDRVCQQDYKVPGTDLTIQMGTPVFIALLGTQHDPKYFPNPELYDPERFEEGNKKLQTPYTFLSFGEGPRNCIGLRFGLMVVKTGLVHILSEFEVQPCKETPIPLKISSRASIMASEGGIPLKFVRSKAQAA